MLQVGNAPLSWGVFEGEAPNNPDWQTVLDQIAFAGYPCVELGPLGFLPTDAHTLRSELVRRNLTLTAGFLYEDLHDPAAKDQVLERTGNVCGLLAAAGASRLVVIDRMCDERQRTAGRPRQAPALDVATWAEMIQTIRTVASIASEDYGLQPVLHPHCGSYIEFEDEIGRALSDLESGPIDLCIDTGHAAVAGMQAKDLVDEYGERVQYFHLKDVDGNARQRLVNSDMTFDEGLSSGLFCPLGEGLVDFPGLKAAVERVGYRGPATVEQDPDPTAASHDGLPGAQQSLVFLKKIGLAAD